MAVPAYTEDLTDIDLAEATTGWAAYGGGGAGLSASPDLAMQGTNCVDKQITNNEKGQVFDNGAGITMAAGDHVFVWLFVATPGLTDTLALRGTHVSIGASIANMCKYHVEGNDTYGAAGRVGRCYPIDHTVYTSNTGSIPYRTQVGTPNGVYQVFGGGLNTTASVKGANLGVDALRYGTGAYLTAGELISAGDASDNPCTFAGFAAQNDLYTNRWGILTDIGGTYELQGRFVIGQNNAKTATLARFEDSDVNIVLVDTVHTAADFTQIVVDHASTVCNWTNINITALGTINPGRVVVNANNPSFTIVGGTWTGIGITTLRSNTSVTSLTWRATAQITQNGATIASCIIDQNNAAAALLSDNPANIQNCQFTSDGSGHAIEFDTPGTYTFTGNTFSGYGAGATTDAAVYNNSGGLVTLNVAGGGDTPTVRNGAGASTVINNTKNLTLVVSSGGTLLSGILVKVIKVSDRSQLFSGTTNVNGEVTYSHDLAGTDVDIFFIDTAYEPDLSDIKDYTLVGADTTIPVSLITDPDYDNP